MKANGKLKSIEKDILRSIKENLPEGSQFFHNGDVTVLVVPAIPNGRHARAYFAFTKEGEKFRKRTGKFVAASLWDRGEIGLFIRNGALATPDEMAEILGNVVSAIT